MKERIPAGARTVLKRLGEAGHEAYLVGGCVRDLLRGVPPHQDVLAAGVAPGPEVGRVLAGLLDRVLSGELPNERAELLRQIAGK